MLWRVEQCSSTHGAICWQPRAGARARARPRARARARASLSGHRAGDKGSGSTQALDISQLLTLILGFLESL